MDYKVHTNIRMPGSFDGVEFVNKQDRGALVGMVMGDGCIRLRPKYRNGQIIGKEAIFQCSHSVKQLPYLQHKANRFCSIFGGKAKILFYETKLKGRELTPYRMCRFVKCSSYLAHLRDWLYIDGKKVISKRMLDMLNTEGLAYYYLDDGCADWWKRVDGSITSVQTTIAVCRPVHECDLLIGWLQGTLGINARITSTNKNNYLRLKTQDSLKLFEAIKIYAPKSMLYKIDSNYIAHEHQIPGKLRTGNDIVPSHANCKYEEIEDKEPQ